MTEERHHDLPQNCVGTCGEPHGIHSEKIITACNDMKSVQKELERCPRTATLLTILGITIPILLIVAGFFSSSIGKDISTMKEGVAKDVKMLVEQNVEVLKKIDDINGKVNKIQQDMIRMEYNAGKESAAAGKNRKWQEEEGR